MLIRSKDDIYYERYVKKRFFIRPFICANCKNKFAMEHGLYVINGFGMGDKYFSSIEDYNPLFDRTIGAKICDICSKDVLKYLLDEFEKENK